MRPPSILYFERFFLALIALGFVHLVLGWNAAMEEMAASPDFITIGPAFLVGIFLISTTINLLLWFLVARRASVAAKWILVVFVGLGVISVVIQLATGALAMNLLDALTLAGVVLDLAAISFLFRPDAKLWFDGGWTGDYPDIFN